MDNSKERDTPLHKLVNTMTRNDLRNNFKLWQRRRIGLPTCQLSYFQDDYRFQSAYCFSIVIKKFDFVRAALTMTILIFFSYFYVRQNIYGIFYTSIEICAVHFYILKRH